MEHAITLLLMWYEKLVSNISQGIDSVNNETKLHRIFVQ